MRPTLRPPNFVLALVLPALLGACGDGGTTPTDGPAEALWAYPVSQVFLARERERPAAVLVRAKDVHRALEEGRPFAEVARTFSDDTVSKEIGGFLGFLRPRGEDPFYGAVQSLPPGVASYPVETAEGIHFLYRHPFDEGRALEAETTVAAYGFFIPWRELAAGADRSQEEARQLAQETVAALRAGETTLLEAALAHGAEPPKREDVFLGRVRRTGNTQKLYERLAATAPGAYVEPFESPEGWSVLLRKPLFRSVVRHILIRHRDTPNRPLSLRRSRDEARELAETVLAEAKPDGSNFADLVRRYSEDTFSLPLDGSLGIAGNGDLPAPVEAVLLDTPPGRVADRVAETADDGFHILYRVN